MAGFARNAIVAALGAAALGTLLMAIRAFGFDKPHHRVRDYLPKVKSK